jgi:hypothetical protein
MGELAGITITTAQWSELLARSLNEITYAMADQIDQRGKQPVKKLAEYMNNTFALDVDEKGVSDAVEDVLRDVNSDLLFAAVSAQHIVSTFVSYEAFLDAYTATVRSVLVDGMGHEVYRQQRALQGLGVRLHRELRRTGVNALGEVLYRCFENELPRDDAVPLLLAEIGVQVGYSHVD